ncbi:putative snf2 family helicase protein [Botrytis fragariae]|uniref:Putative snf2 family helicase protein n=1 Tax=Botrytis fragariae TaxID=1964551 RepID=A0A8H6EKZ9_9HELO|nr:putative snf2 family helicase protein [Botrytis fragariae]KAF5875730.1 putative snf2 family helicase protein [Botrytis fragariae]
MTPPTPTSDDPFNNKRYIGMKSIWSNVKKGAVGQDPNQKNWAAQQIKLDSSFAALPPPSRDSISASKNSCFSDLTNYIPAGSIRIHKHGCSLLTEEVFTCRSWHAFYLPSDITNFQQSILYLPNTVQGQLLRSAALAEYTGIHNAGWIRMEFKAKDKNTGQVRVYILPDDIGNAVLDRSMKQLRKGMEALLDKLDVSNAAWQGTWSDDTPIQHINSELDDKEFTDVVSLFDMFNNLPSPKPDPGVIVGDRYVQDAMRSLLTGNVQGLNPDTQMHPYQCQTAAMMLQRETQPGYIMDPRLRRIQDQYGQSFYCDLSANVCLREPRLYEAPRGGICAEDMGLGKTLICLALILSTKYLRPQMPDEHSIDSIPTRKETGSLLDMCASTVGRQGIPWEIVLGKMESEGELGFSQMHAALTRGIGYYWYEPDPPARETRRPIASTKKKIWLAKSTLVVVPPNLVHQWIQEIEKHTTSLSYLVINDMKIQVPAAHELAKYDIILFGRRRFEREATEETLTCPQSTITCEHCFGRPEAFNCACEISTENAPAEAFKYRSPLRDLHFKRLITDEGHGFGNVTKSGQSNAIIMVDFLHLDARWIISGTPTNGLHGKDDEFSRACELRNNDTKFFGPENAKTPLEKSCTNSKGVSIMQETKDLEKLGNILKSYLKARPWANTAVVGDQASWLDLVIKPRYNQQIHGDPGILKSTLKSMIIRHTARDITGQLRLPPLNKKIVSLEGCFQDKLSLNIFSMMITINAVTSEREGVDYFFHPKNRRALLTLFSNLRQASFTWSGYTKAMIENSLQTAEKFLAKDDINPEDKKLLQEAIRAGKLALSNGIFTAVSQLHEMAMYVQNPLPEEIRRAWALDYHDGNPTLMGASMICAAKEVFYTYRRGSLVDPSESVFDTTKLTNFGENLMRRIAVNADIDHVEFRTAQAHFTDHRPSARPEISTSVKNPMWRESTIISTASSKLSYLMDQIFLHHENEKIIVFYEAEHVGYYIAQALKCVNIEHLVYTKRDSTSERSKCVVKFNSVAGFRVMLMDVNQAAFGLDMSAASRIYFVNPVFSPQVEAQAIKRSHRIGQLRPVHVETLVLNGSIEEVILTRRSTMNGEEHAHLKNILDDRKIYDWIKNVRFYPIASSELPGPEQFAPLSYPQHAFEKRNSSLIDAYKDVVPTTESGTLEPVPAQLTESRHSVSGGETTRNVVRLGNLSHTLGYEISNFILATYKRGLRERIHEQELGLGRWIDGLMLSHQIVNASTSGEAGSSYSARGVGFATRSQSGLTTETGQPLLEDEETDENDQKNEEHHPESLRTKPIKTRSAGNDRHNEFTPSEVSRELAETEVQEDGKEETEKYKEEQGEERGTMQGIEAKYTSNHSRRHETQSHSPAQTLNLEDRIKEMVEKTAIIQRKATQPSASIFGGIGPSAPAPSVWETLEFGQITSEKTTSAPSNTSMKMNEPPNEELAAEKAEPFENEKDEDMEDKEVADDAEDEATNAESDASQGNLYDA